MEVTVLCFEEVSNLVFLGLRYACGWEDVSNDAIVDVMAGLSACTIAEIEPAVIAEGVRRGLLATDAATTRAAEKMAEIAQTFMQMNDYLRKDLGRDAAFFDRNRFH